jgi:hypothetical protein
MQFQFWHIYSNSKPLGLVWKLGIIPCTHYVVVQIKDCTGMEFYTKLKLKNSHIIMEFYN